MLHGFVLVTVCCRSTAIGTQILRNSEHFTAIATVLVTHQLHFGDNGRVFRDIIAFTRITYATISPNPWVSLSIDTAAFLAHQKNSWTNIRSSGPKT